MRKLDISKEEELQILEDGVKSPFWQYFAAWLSHEAMTSAGAALSPIPSKPREWEAGQANGLKKVLQRPDDRIREIRRYLQQTKAEGK